MTLYGCRVVRLEVCKIGDLEDLKSVTRWSCTPVPRWSCNPVVHSRKKSSGSSCLSDALPPVLARFRGEDSSTLTRKGVATQNHVNDVRDKGPNDDEIPFGGQDSASGPCSSARLGLCRCEARRFDSRRGAAAPRSGRTRPTRQAGDFVCGRGGGSRSGGWVKARHGAERRARNTGSADRDRPRSGAEASRRSWSLTVRFAGGWSR